MTRYEPGEGNIIWDVFPEENNSEGHLEQFLQLLKQEDFDALIEEELDRVIPFLLKWENLLSKFKSNSCKSLKEWFLQTPKLSGILYFSHNTVFPEGFFESSPGLNTLRHPTDRVINARSRLLLPSARDLTFSFPRKYIIDGFYNSWGFVRVERKDNKGNGCGIALSVTTLDSRIMHLMRLHGFQRLAYLYNQSWNGSVHDYIHHIALYTNPSFGIGKRSPMSLWGYHGGIDQWGQDMVDTFNYEYWAHRTHRLITQDLIEAQHENILSNARIYFEETARFQEVLIDSNYESEYIEKVIQYLSCIYVWPLHILIHPYGPVMDKIGTFIEDLQFLEKKDTVSEACALLCDSGYPQELPIKAQLLVDLMNHFGWDEDHYRIKPLVSAFNRFKHMTRSLANSQFQFNKFLSDLVKGQIELDDRDVDLVKEIVNFKSILFPENLQNQEGLLELRAHYLRQLSRINHSPLARGVQAALKSLKLDELVAPYIRPFGKYEWIRFKTEMTVQRGMYNCWEHDHAIIYKKQEADPVEVFHHFLGILQETYMNSKFHFIKSRYELGGIYP